MNSIFCSILQHEIRGLKYQIDHNVKLVRSDLDFEVCLSMKNELSVIQFDLRQVANTQLLYPIDCDSVITDWIYLIMRWSLQLRLLKAVETTIASSFKGEFRTKVESLEKKLAEAETEVQMQRSKVRLCFVCLFQERIGEEEWQGKSSRQRQTDT